MKLLAACAIAVLSTGCALLKPTKDRLDLITLNAPCAGKTRDLLVLLPGRFDSPQDLIEHGLVDAVRKRNLDADIVIPDLHFGYYMARTAPDRLHQDVVLPAARQGYARVWLAGISLGGFGALLHARDHGPTHGLVLIAPYLGGDRIHEEIRQAGGLRAWNPETSQAEEYERDLWKWVRDLSERPAASASAAPVFIGYGVDDDFAPSNRLLASALPGARELAVEGGHDWSPWLAAWEGFLDMQPIAACHGAGGAG